MAMLAQIGLGQLIGGCVEALIWIGLGVWLIWFWPRRMRREVEIGKLTEELGQAKLKKLPPRLGYLLLIYGLARMVEAAFRYF